MDDARAYPDDYCMAYRYYRCLEPPTETVTLWGEFVGRVCKDHLPAPWAIVADLAESDPQWKWEEAGGQPAVCTLCNGLHLHTPECPWRRAREWIDAQA